MMIEQAKEELQILEGQHPNRFEYLKLELKSFISLHQSQNNNNMAFSPNSISLPVSSTATTQASSSSKKRKKIVTCSELRKHKIPRVDRVEVVLERAQACLRKIHQFKTSFHG
ncbi:uncharacterized protein LOC130777660 [Actinidia eriantha]|uniref:uncharacterized protein LOC130777660 n=1 Tax=Actinidia eriantha TaxID=165200 RepID=UPI002584D8A8|nr:uncharacterized protein LOC130777660 [Actinidia eriantha]